MTTCSWSLTSSGAAYRRTIVCLSLEFTYQSSMTELVGTPQAD